MKDRVSKFNETLIELSNGVNFTIVHDFKNMEGAVNSFDAAFQSWLARTDEYTAEDFVSYVKSKEPNLLFVTKEQYDSVTNGKVISASEEEYKQENN